MASSSYYSRKPKNNNMPQVNASRIHTNSPLNNTIRVQADPANFRAVVQQLTGASTDPSIHRHPTTMISSYLHNGRHNSVDVGPRRPVFKLQERRQSTRKLEIQLMNNNAASSSHGLSPMQRIMTSVSPVSTLDMFMSRGSPTAPLSLNVEQEERAIAEKSFYLHPSPLGTARKPEPQLLPLFPINLPRDSSSPNS